MYVLSELFSKNFKSTSAQAFSAWVLEGQLNDRAALWAQYWTWGPGVALGDNERYLSQPADFNNAWTRAYANALADLKFSKYTNCNIV